MKLFLHPHATEKDLTLLWETVQKSGLRYEHSRDTNTAVLYGDTAKIDPKLFYCFYAVREVQRLTEPYVLASKKNHPLPTVITVGQRKIGKDFTVIAGPCAVENYDMLYRTAKFLKDKGIDILRAGAFKPRTSPYYFQGLGLEGIALLAKLKKEIDIAVTTEITSEKYLKEYDHIDILQIGARNMQNYELLKEVGKQGKPVLLKRGITATMEEWLLSAEYIMSEGNHNVILCERGVRDNLTQKTTLDIKDIPLLKEKTHLPVFVDPSHVATFPSEVPNACVEAKKNMADGLLIEIHPSPKDALCDGLHALTYDRFGSLLEKL